jgi:hypothetical protein
MVQLFTACGLDTGFTLEEAMKVNPGLELYPSQEWSYVVKGPGLCDLMSDTLRRTDVTIDCVIVPMRCLEESAESRRRTASEVGGLWGTSNPAEQEQVLAYKFHKLMLALSESHVPVVLLQFPRLVHDPWYVYTKLIPSLVLPGWLEFKRAFEKTARPELVHEYVS